MKNSQNSIYAFAIYLVLLGLSLMLIPNLLLPIFGFAPSADVWIRVLGMVLFLLSWYYFAAAHYNWLEFYRISVVLRIFILFFFTAFVLLGLAPWPLIIFGVVDSIFAIWTKYTLVVPVREK